MTVETVSDVAAVRVREVRKRRGWQLSDLAARCAELGAGHLTENVIENIEGGRRSAGRRRRDITVDELLVLAKALHVFPLHLLVPPGDPETTFEVTPAIRANRFRMRCWIRAVLPLPLTKVGETRDLWSEVPDDEYEAHEAGQCPACGGRAPRDLGGSN